MPGHSLRLALIQLRCAAEAADNLAKASRMLREAASAGAQLACLPELFLGPYFCQREDPRLFDLAEPVPGPTTEALSAIARETGLAIVGSVFERRQAGLYHNTAVVLDGSGALVGRYRKMHIPDDPLYYEKYYFTPGDLGFAAFDTRYAKVGTLVCWDQWFPEAARLTAMAGAQVLVYPTAIGWHPREKAEWGQAQQEAWETVQRAHAIANGVFVAAVNRVGHEGPADGGLEFWGGSFVYDPFGRLLGRASSQREEVVVVDCDLRLIEEVRRNWPFWRDRRIDAYGGLLRRWLEEQDPGLAPRRGGHQASSQ
jgi:N-carbamoylputrescine amidase